MRREEFMIEVCANGVESCIAAQEGGADRVELCAGIPEGGTTPSYGEIKVARRVLTTTRLHVIIRPRGGDFGAHGCRHCRVPRSGGGWRGVRLPECRRHL